MAIKFAERKKPVAQTLETVINLIPQNVHRQLFGENYTPLPQEKISQIRKQLIDSELTELVDISEPVDLLIPKLSLNLPEWIDDIIERTYQEYFFATNQLKVMQFSQAEPPKISPYFGWSKFQDERWVRCKGIEETAIFFDFETYPDENGLMRPFMACAISETGIIYSWLADILNKLPEVVEFGESVKLFVGHNSVAFDRRFVKEFYDFGHDKRMLDTFSLYSVLLGMSSEQIEKYRWAKDLEHKPFKWVDYTTNGNLKDLSNFILGLDMDKSLREELLKPKKVKGKLVVTPKEIIKSAMAEIWNYCVIDTTNTGLIFQIFIKRILKYDTKIYLAGQLERSTLRINVVSDIKARIQKVINYNNTELKRINQIVLKELDKKLKEKDHYVISMLEGYVLKDWYERIYKSKLFEKYLLSFSPQLDLDHVTLPDCLISLGWEFDDSESKRSVQKNATLDKLKAVHQFLTADGTTKIAKKSITEWVTRLLKKPNEKIDEEHISIAGKIAPVIIGLRWHGERLYIKGNTWGITISTTEGKSEFVSLPHSKGKENVGTPLSKDYRTLVTIGRFTADIELAEFFDTISDTSLWEKFNKRFQNIYIYNNTWLPEIVPSGTVTGRPTGALAVVMANPDDKGEFYQTDLPRLDGTVLTMEKAAQASSRAGSEMKSWFCVADGHTKVNADYSGQESEIFAALIDAITRWCGLNVFSCLVHAGNSDLGTDIHTFVAKYLSGACGQTFPRSLAKNANFANQFLCGKERLATMIFISLKGAMTEEQCMNIAVKFQEFTRGRQEWGKYYDGIASLGFNRIKELAKKPNQKCLLTGRTISDPLNAYYCDSEMTTRVNFSIQGTGQGLIDICSIVTRYMATKFEIPYNYCFLIHDDYAIDTLDEFSNTMAYFMQIGHLFSKALLYHKFGAECMPLNKMFFETVEQDKYLRKSPMLPYFTPTQTEAIPLGKVVKAKDCLPLPEILDRIRTGCI